MEDKVPELEAQVVAANEAEAARWSRELSAAVAGQLSWRAGQLLFVDAAMPGLERALGEVDRRGRAVILLVREGAPIPKAYLDRLADDVLVHPFRAAEVLSKLRGYEQILAWDEVRQLNASFQEILAGLQQDLALAERLQKNRLPARFPEVKGFKVAHRYLAGLRPGGDYFDLADARDASQLSLVMTDASSSRLAGAVLNALVAVAMKISAEASRSCTATLEVLSQEVRRAMADKDRLSLLYGVVSRRDYVLKWVNLGTSRVFHRPAAGGFRELDGGRGDALLRAAGPPPGLREGEVQLGGGDRLVVVSDGFVDAMGGQGGVLEVLERLADSEAARTLNELVYRVKALFKDDDDMPEQDCTAAVFDVDASLIRLAR